jgi:hypothetical protein
MEPHLLPHERLFESGFIQLYTEDITSQSKMTKEQLDELWMHLSSPVVRMYLKELSLNIVRDLMRLDFTRAEDQLKLSAKYSHGRGALELIDSIIVATQPKEK